MYNLEVKVECTLGEWHPECPTDMRAFKPDAFIVDKSTQQVVVRGMADTD